MPPDGRPEQKGSNNMADEQITAPAGTLTISYSEPPEHDEQEGSSGATVVTTTSTSVKITEASAKQLEALVASFVEGGEDVQVTIKRKPPKDSKADDGDE